MLEIEKYLKHRVEQSSVLNKWKIGERNLLVNTLINWYVYTWIGLVFMYT